MMIKNILTVYATRLDEYLSRFHHQPEGLAEVGFIGNAWGTNRRSFFHRIGSYSFIADWAHREASTNILAKWFAVKAGISGKVSSSHEKLTPLQI